MPVLDGKIGVIHKDYVLDYTSALKDVIMETESGVGGLTYRYTYGLEKVNVVIKGAPTMKAILRMGVRELDLVTEYTGHPYDAVLSLYFAEARMYDAADRRFVAMDSVEGSPDYPVTHVKYIYACDNPLLYIDPTGLWGSKIHNTKTVEWAKDELIIKADAEVIGKSDNGVDSGLTSPFLWFSKSATSWRFNTNVSGKDSRQIHYEEQYKAGVGHFSDGHEIAELALSVDDNDYWGQQQKQGYIREAEGYWRLGLEEFGKGLHPYQDIEAHKAWEPSYIIPSPHTAYLDKTGCFYNSDGSTDLFDDPQYDLNYEKREFEVIVSVHGFTSVIKEERSIWVAREGSERITITENKTRNAIKDFISEAKYSEKASYLKQFSSI